MYDFSKAAMSPLITKDYVLEKVSQEQIFFYYFGPFERGKAYHSRLRRDSSPSVGFIVTSNGTLYHNDLARDEKLDCFAYVQKLFGLNFKEALYKIANDFGIAEGSKSIVPQKLMDEANRVSNQQKIQKFIQVTPERWNEDNLAFWDEYHITEEELIRAGIYPVCRLFLNRYEVFNKERLPRYAYYKKYRCELDGTVKEGVKIYTPHSETMKWLSSIPNNIPFGMESLDYGLDYVIVAKSRKDELVLKKFYRNVISVQNESKHAFSDILRSYLFNNFKRVILFFDADETGIRVSQELSELGFERYHTPLSDYALYGVKDPSDFVKKYGLGRMADLLTMLNLDR
jgi:hypothetical protein